MPAVATGVTKRFGDRVALRDVSVTVEPGELLAIIGPNGAGKTTLLSILAGILAPDAGELGRPAREIGWVPQQAAVYGKLSGRENLKLFARLGKVPAPGAVVARMLEQTGLADRADDELGTLSGGNRQRVNIAVGLLSDPDVLLLDEPSSPTCPRHARAAWGFG